jgi:hypothetical protein
MKTIPIILALAGLFSFVTTVRADYEIKISSSSNVAKLGRELVMKVKGSKVRMEMAEGKHTITDADAGTRFLVDDQRKQATDMSRTLKASTPIKPTATGNKEKIGDYSAEEYSYTVLNGLKISVWVALDYPKDKAEALRALTKVRTPDLNALPGPVIRTVVSDSTGSAKSQTDVKSVTEVTLDEKEFEVPKDYQIKKAALPPGLQGK